MYTIKNFHTMISRVVDNNVKAGIWYFMLNSAFVYLISLKYFSLLFTEAATMHPVYSVLACISHFFALAFLPLFVCFLPLYFFTKKYSLTKWVTIIVSTLSLILLTIDAYVFSLYRFHLNSYVLEQVFGPASGQVFEFTIGQYIIVACVLVLVLVIQFFMFKLAEKLTRKSCNTLLVVFASIWCFVFIIVQIERTYGLTRNDRSFLAIENHFPMVVPFYPNQLFQSADSTFSLNVQHHTYQYPLQPLHTHSTKKNLLVIGFDSWRASTLDSLCTPHIYSFAKKSQRYMCHYSGSNGTRSGVFTMFYGLPGTYFRDFAAQHISPVLIEQLKLSGYDMHLFPSASLRNPPLDQNTFYLLSDQCDPTKGMNAWQRDENLAANFRKFLAERDTTVPFFSFLFFDSLHSMIKPDGYKGPFQPSWEFAQYEKLGKGVDPTEFLNLYKNMVYYLDSLVGNVLNDLTDKGLLENTIVVITGDHAQEFDDNLHGFWGHNGNYTAAQLHTPLVYYLSENKPGEYQHLTSHYDLVPTLMRDLFAVENPVSDYSIGSYLQDTFSRTPLIVDSYIGIGIIDGQGNSTNILYDGTLQLVDKNWKEDFESKPDTNLVNECMNQLNKFVLK